MFVLQKLRSGNESHRKSGQIKFQLTVNISTLPIPLSQYSTAGLASKSEPLWFIPPLLVSPTSRELAIVPIPATHNRNPFGLIAASLPKDIDKLLLFSQPHKLHEQSTAANACSAPSLLRQLLVPIICHNYLQVAGLQTKFSGSIKIVNRK